MSDKKKILFVIGFYFLSFVAALLIAGQVLNYDRIHPSAAQGDTSLIKLYVKNSGMLINEMNGYTQPMNSGYLRQSVTPVSESKTITLQFSEPVSNARAVSYTLMDDSGSEEIEAGECPEIQRVEGQRQTQIVFAAELQPGREYCLNLTVEDEAGKVCYYYTRVIYGNDLMAYDKLQFAMDFHRAAFEKTASSRIAEYLKTSSDGVSNDFRKVSIYSDSEIVTWGNLEPEVIGDVRMTVLNMDNQTGEIRLVYEVIVRDDSGNDYNYMVNEYFSISSTGSNVDLLDYSRTMEEKLDNQSFDFNNNLLRLGMIKETALDIQVYGRQETEAEEEETSETAGKEDPETVEYNTYISFVADGGLWVYNSRDNLMTQAFGFERKNQTSTRDASYLEHGIKVLRTEDNGNLYFAVYGYMYNGDNEGSFGISVNRYNRADGTYSEILFVPYDKSFTMLSRGVQEMAFIDGADMLYLCLEDTIYRFNIGTKTSEVILEQAGTDSCAIAADGRSVVLSEPDASGQISRIEWRNLESGEVQTIEKQGSGIEMLGMIGENLVYGVREASDDAGRLDVIYIVDFMQNVLKEYRVDGGYISGVLMKEDLIEISRKTNSNTDMGVDYIVYNRTEGQGIAISNVNQAVRMRETWLSVSEYGNSTPVVLFARGIESYRDTWMEFSVQTEDYTGYFVYENNNLSKYATFKEAYMAALEGGGKVLDGQGKTISRPAGRTAEKDLDGYSITLAGEDEKAQQEAVIRWIMNYEKLGGTPELTGTDMFSNLETNFPAFHVVDLSGIALSDALARVSEGIPLVVKNSEGTWCVVEGYNSGYIVVADPKDGTVSGYEWDSAVAGIASSGNVIYTYYK